MIFVGFIAEKESGKTTTLNFIKEHIPGAVEVMLAEHLKECCARVFKKSRFELDDQAERKKIFTNPIEISVEVIQQIADFFEMQIPNDSMMAHVGKKLYNTREILQYVGTEICRSVEDDIHLKWAMRRAPEASVYVVTDVRFENEFDFFYHNPPFLPIYIERPKVGALDATSAHASEAGIPKLRGRCHIEIINNGTLEDLQRAVAKIVIPQIYKTLNGELANLP